MMGKLITAEMMTMITINCLRSNFIRYPLTIMRMPTKKHKAKNIYNPISPNARLAYVLKNNNTGDHSAKYNEKKKSDHRIVRLMPSLNLFKTIFLFFLLRKI